MNPLYILAILLAQTVALIIARRIGYKAGFSDGKESAEKRICGGYPLWGRLINSRS